MRNGDLWANESEKGGLMLGEAASPHGSELS